MFSSVPSSWEHMLISEQKTSSLDQRRYGSFAREIEVKHNIACIHEKQSTTRLRGFKSMIV